jgi:hypothetical protein
MAIHSNNPTATHLESIDGPVELTGRAIGVSMPCPMCGYDLRGAPATGQCAECGCGIQQVLASAIDPASHRLPPLADPRAVGDGLVLITAGLTAGVVVPIVGMLCAGAAAQGRRIGVSSAVVEHFVSLAAVVVAVLGLGGCWFMRPRDNGSLQKTALRAVVLVVVGTLVMAIGLKAMLRTDVLFGSLGLGSAGVGLLLGLGGVRLVLVEAGRRCRLFRTATFRRQRIPTLMLAAGLATVFLVGARLARHFGEETMDLTLGALGLTVACILAVGLTYLVANAVWIRRDLCQPPPRLASLLGEGFEPEASPQADNETGP